MIDLTKPLSATKPFQIADVPDGAEAMMLAEVARHAFKAGADLPALAVYVARDGTRQAMIEGALGFFAPEAEVLTFPAWDCQPYDRSSPNATVLARRMNTLSRLARSRGGDRPRIVVTTINAATQRTPALDWVRRDSLSFAPGNAVDRDEIARWLDSHGFLRSGTVRDTGEYAVRGGILDLFPAGHAAPIRLDFFGDTLESIRAFDPETQRTTVQVRSLDLVPMAEFQLTSEAIRRFRTGYTAQFGAPARDDVLYEAVSEGRRFPGMDHWLPLFHERLDTLAAYTPDARFVLDPLADQAARERFTQIHDYHESRKTQPKGGGAPYKPMPPDSLYLTPDEWSSMVEAHGAVQLSPFATPEMSGQTVSAKGRKGRNFATERADEKANVFDAVVGHVDALTHDKRRVVVASWSDGARERLLGVLADHGLKKGKPARSLDEARKLKPDEIAFAVCGLESGFEMADLAVVGEQDILGERLSRPKRASRRGKDFIAEVTSMTAGDLVVHVDHGIARFVGLKTIEAGGAPHDCLELHYANNDRLFLPVENIELLTRYGSEDTEAQLDRLGGAGWQNRRAKLKKRIREMAKGLMKIAAQRLLREAPRLAAPTGAYEDFVARFPFDETEDQQNAIDAVLDDMASGKPMDRLVCGDVGFGKTEVALRSAFVAAMDGKQVAVVAPTTLLARQHYQTFRDRFQGLPLRVAHASRMVSAAELKVTKAGLADGSIDIVVGTHALLGKGIDFKNLGLLVIDEEQHFGVGHKERLKELKAEVHVLTLSATPIPRTLQLALTGVRELSIIATAPVDRLAVRTFITPFDPLMVREALLRERYRGGQSFYVCPRIEDLAEVKAFLAQNVSELKVGIGHGQMAASELETVMGQFYEGAYDVLLSTTIVESGLDIPRANTLIVHRADMFGLSQLYQLRGRVGRSKTRAYALFTTQVDKAMTVQAERRLKVLQSLDTLGAGFQLASHDLDIRGAGNLLGDEQSGHIKEVGYELYQQMLQEAVAAMKAGVEVDDGELEDDGAWSPTIAIGAPVIIPETYIEDLDVRMALYRRLAKLDTDEEIESFGAEMIDRFGKPPAEVNQLLKIVSIKGLCRRANVEKVEAGPKGIIVSFKDGAFANPNGLVQFVASHGKNAKVRPDMRVVFTGDYESAEDRLEGSRKLLRQLTGLAERRKAA